MAQNGKPQNDDSPTRKGLRSLPPAADADDAWPSGDESPMGMLAKPKRNGWLKKNPNLIKGVAAGVSFSLMVLLLGGGLLWWLSGDAKTAALPAATPAPLMLAPPQAPPNVPKGPPKSLWQKTPEQLKKEASEKARVVALPGDVAKWKKEDYFRARRQNDPKLLEAITRLGKKSAGANRRPKD